MVCHRPRAGRPLDQIFNQFSSSRFVADFDDLLFCPDSLDAHPSLISGKTSFSALLRAHTEYFEGASRFSEFTVSTFPLKKKIQQLFPDAKCRILHNGWSDDWHAFSELLPGPEEKHKKICYFAGTSNHDQDLYLISDQLREFLRENHTVSLEVFGSIDISLFRSVKTQVTIGLPAPFYLFPSIIKQAWISIAPLIDSGFNQCKSAIKFIESGLFGVPLIASPTADLLRVQNDGLLFASQEDQWYSALNRLKNREYYEKCAKSAREEASRHSVEGAMRRSTIFNDWT